MTGNASGDWQARITALLEDVEAFPIVYTHKFVGRNTPAFVSGAQSLLAEFSGIKLVSDKESAQGNHRSFTFELLADGPAVIIRLMEKTAVLPDLHVML